MRFPIRATFYYPWFPETWGDGSHYTPTIGQYASSDEAVIQAHIYEMLYARIRAGIASWWGPDSPYSPRLELLLDAAVGTPFRWCAYYEEEGYAQPSAGQIAAELDTLLPLSKRTEWLHVGGKPVLFVYADPTDKVDMVQRWVQGNSGKFFLVLKVFDGYKTVTPQPDSWHQYAPANNVQDLSPYCFTVSPGFWKSTEVSPRLARDLSRFEADIKAQVASKADWQLITTHNEFGEGTAIEPTTEWRSAYLDVLKKV